MSTTIDDLEIKIQSSAEDASSDLDKLANSMLKLASSMSINVGKMSGIAIGLNSITKASQGMNSRNISTLGTALNKVAGVDSGSISRVAGSVTQLKNSMSGGFTADVSGIANVATALSKLGGVKATQGTQTLLQMKDQLIQFVNGMNQIGSFNFDATGLSNTISAIAKLGGKSATQAVSNLPSISAQLQNFVRQMNQIGSMSFDNANLTELVASIGKLGSVASGRAVTNIPLLATNLKNLFQTLSTAPNVSQNIIDMTNAIAKLAQTGASSGSAARSLTGGLVSFSSVSGKAKKHAFSLASAFGKLYASYFLVIRGISALKNAMDVSSSLTEVENVVRTTFGDMEYKVTDLAKTSIEQLGMSELSLKQYASTFQAMGSAMGIGSKEIEKANSYLNGVTDGYVGLSDSLADVSLNMTKLTADIASFYDKDQADVAEDLQSIYTGMVVPLRKYGLDLTQATLQEWALKQGLDADVSSMTQAEKTMLRYQYVMANTVAAQGDFADTAQTWANQIRILKQNFQQLASIIGGALVNAFKPFVQTLNAVMKKVIAFATTVTNALGAIFGWKFEVSGGGVADDWSDAASAAGDVADSSGKAADNAKKMKSYLLGIDELNVLEPDDSDSGSGSGSGGSGSGGSGGGASGGLVKTDTIWKDFESDIENLYQLGEYIRDALIGAMESIDWDSVYEKARNFGTGLAQFLNGLFAGSNGITLFGEIGKTIAGALNTVIYAALAFGQEFDFKQFGYNIADGINNFFSTFDFAAAAETLNTWAQGLFDVVSTAITNVKWMDVYNGITEFLENLDIGTVAIIIGTLALKKIAALKISETVLTTIGETISKKLAAVIASKLGLELATNAGIGSALLAAGGSVATTFVAGFKALLGSNAAASALTFINPIIVTFTGIASILAGVGVAVVNFFSMWEEGFSWLKEALMVIGFAIAAVGAVILGAPALVAGVIAGIVAAIATIAIVVHDNWDAIVEWTGNMVNSIAEWFVGLGESIITGIQNAWTFIQDLWTNAITWINETFIIPISEAFTMMIATISEAFTNAVLVVEEIWVTVSTWFNETVITPIVNFFTAMKNSVLNLFKVLWNGIKSVWMVVSTWFNNTVIIPTRTFFEFFKEAVHKLFSALWENVQGIWSTVSGWFSNVVINPVKNAFSNACDNIASFFGNLWTNVKNGVVGAMNAVISSVERAVNGIIDMLNTLHWEIPDWVPSLGGKSFGFHISKISLPKIPAFEVGGFPEDGLFFANHNEMVGEFSNGKTAVANNEQIVAGIMEGVKAAVTEALAPYLSDIADNTRETAEKDMSINVDGRELVTAINSRISRNGFSFT